MKNVYLIAAVSVIIILVAGVAIGLYVTSKSSTTTSINNSSSKPIQIVAAENFWGSLISQLGGTHVNVTSIVSDPNTDPHEYESQSS